MNQLYAVTPVDTAVPIGLDALEGNAVAVLHSDREAVAPTDRDAVLAFGRTIQEIARHGPALPMRYGTTVADLTELRLLIAEHEEAWSARLAAVGDCCELIVHLGGAPSTVPRQVGAELSGRDYLKQRAEAARSRDAVHDELRAVVRPWLREARTLRGARSDRVALLVPRDAATQARARVERWGADRPDLGLAVTGPWPPFSFCEAPT
jgi:hypothetical protein